MQTIGSFVSNFIFVTAMLLALHSPALASDTASRISEIEGRIVKIVPSKKEIYVQGPERKNEYYFNEQTKLLEKGSEIPFSSLQEGFLVKVTANKIGKRLDPVKVEVLDR